MEGIAVETEGLDFANDRSLLSAPWLDGPLYQCGNAVTVFGFLAHADLQIAVQGVTVVMEAAGFPEPLGATIALPDPLSDGEEVMVRQHSGGLVSPWSAVLRVRDHTVNFPAGPPRPQIQPVPLYRCGSRTGVGNLLNGGNVWVTADGVDVGRINGCAKLQGVSVNPDFGADQQVRAHFELCRDPAAPSVEYLTQPSPPSLSTPQFEPIYEGGEQLIIKSIANGARVSLNRNGTPVGTYRCWGGGLEVGLSPPLTAGETFTATQVLCSSNPSSPPGSGSVEPCGNLPAPIVGPIQNGDDSIVILQAAPSASIRVYINFAQVGLGSAPQVSLVSPVAAGDLVHIVQALGDCTSQLARQVVVRCVNPPAGPNPASLDLFPVGFSEYDDGGAVKGSVYYPADDDGPEAPFNRRVAGVGRAPIVFLAHGNHSPADPSFLGYDYFQHSLAKMGIIAVSVDCNALNGAGGGVGNIEDRADLIIDSIAFFQGLDSDAASEFSDRIDFSQTGLMGHSRGGDAVVMIPGVLAMAGVTTRSVLALAPTNFRYWFGLPTIRSQTESFMTVLPAADGDVVDNNGAQFYDQARPGNYKSQLYVHSTNHNFFNREWLFDDGATTVASRSDHERVLDTYGCAFFRASLLGHLTVEFLDGRTIPQGVAADLVHLSFMNPGNLTVDDHEDGNMITQNSLGLPTAQLGVSVDEYSFEQTGGAFNASFFGESIGMVMEAEEAGALFRSELGGVDLTSTEIWLRVAEVVEGMLPATATGFELGVEDSAGTQAWIDADSVGGVPRPFERPTRMKTMLSTLRFRTRCLGAERDRIELTQVEAILIRYNQRGSRALAFDDLQIVKI